MVAVLLGLASGREALCGADFQSWTTEEKEEFLRQADIISMTTLREGITESVRATLQRGQVRHEAHIQDVNVRKSVSSSDSESGFFDSYRYNIAAYHLDRLLGLGMVPVTVYREVNGQPAAVTWWVDDLLMEERTRYLQHIKPVDSESWNQQIHLVRVFDELIYNTDRNLGNLLITTGWRVRMIDHTRAFRPRPRLRRPPQLLRCDRRLLGVLRQLETSVVLSHLSPWLTEAEISALMARRDAVVTHFDHLIRDQGEIAVLFELRVRE